MLPSHTAWRLASRHRHTVATEVGEMTHVHGLVHIADTMDEDFESECLLGTGRHAVGEDVDLFAYGSNHVALGVERSVGIIDAFVNILIVPRLGIGIFGRVAGIVEPVGPVDGRTAVEDSRHRVGGSLAEMVFGNKRHGVMPLLAPGKCLCRNGKQTEQQIYFFHRLRFMV